MNRVIVHLFCGATILAFTPAASSGQDVPNAIASSLHWADSRNSRRAQAAEWLTEIATIDKQIPTLSPAEDAWLKVEYDDELARNNGFFTPRASRARNGKEGSSRFAKPIAREMTSILEQLASASPLAQQSEVALWSKLAYLALDLNFWGDISRLGELGVLTRDPKSKLGTAGYSSYQETLRGYWASRVQEILRAIVLPYLDHSGR